MVELDSRWIFTFIVLAVACERLVELVVSRRNEKALKSRGAVEVGSSHYPWMVALHTSFLAAGPLEVWLLARPFIPWLGWTAAAVLLGTMALRYWTIRTLAGRWTTRVLVLPEAPLVEGGPFRFLRHPNYLAVALELFALPLIHGAFLAALIWGLLNLWMLRVRISVEDRALRGDPPSFVKVF